MSARNGDVTTPSRLSNEDDEPSTIATPPPLTVTLSPQAIGEGEENTALVTGILKQPGRKVSHIRARTTDLGSFRAAENSLSPANAIGGSSGLLEATSTCAQDDLVRVRRVFSEPKVSNSLGASTRRGLAHLESQDYSEVHLTSDDELAVALSSEGASEAEDSPNVDRDSLSPFGRKKKRRSKKKKKGRKSKESGRTTVQVPYFKDENGEVRDEYGFKVEEPQIFNAALTGAKPAPVSHDTKKRILSKEARRVRQRRVWNELLETIGTDISCLSMDSFERWRKYYGGPDDGAEVYLCHITSPSVDQNGSGGSHHRKQASGSSQGSSQSASTPPLHFHTESTGRKTRAFQKIGSTFESVVRILKPRSGKRRSECDNTITSSPSIEQVHKEQLTPPTPTTLPSRAATTDFPNDGSDLDTTMDSVTMDGLRPPQQISSNMARQVTQTIRHEGIPPRLRRDLWLACSGALTKQRAASPTQQYEYLLECAVSGPTKPEMAEIIERDLHRTFPTNYHFEEEEGITRMRRVLLAYSLRNRAVGYCQSMNFLVAVLLLHMEENWAFWVLAAIVEDLVPGHYTKQMTGMHVDQKVFESLVKVRLPKIYAHLEAIDFPLEFVTYQWFLCLFVNSLPLDTTLRIWDCFLHEGSKALFRAGLAILMILQKDILATNSFQELYDCLSLGDNFEKKAMLTGERVLKVAYDPISFRSFPSSKISQLRTQHLPVVLKNLGQQTDWEDFRAGRPLSSAIDKSVLEQLHKGSAGHQPKPTLQHDGRAEDDGGDVILGDDGAEILVDLNERTPTATTLVEDDETDENETVEDDEAKPALAKEKVPYPPRQDKHKVPQQYSSSKIRSFSSERSHRTPYREGSLSKLVKRKVTRRPSTSFKYQLGNNAESPKDALSRLGIMFEPGRSRGGFRPSSMSCHSPESMVQSLSQLPRRASTNSPLLLAETEGMSLSEYLKSKLNVTDSDHGSIGGSGDSVAGSIHSDSGMTMHRYPIEATRPGLPKKPVEVSDEDILTDNEEEEADDIPLEFSGLLPTLAYVMSAQQVNVADDSAVLGRIPPRRRQYSSDYDGGDDNEESSDEDDVAVGDDGEGDWGDNVVLEREVSLGSALSSDIDTKEKVVDEEVQTSVDNNSNGDCEDGGKQPLRRRKRSILSSWIGWSKKG